MAYGNCSTWGQHSQPTYYAAPTTPPSIPYQTKSPGVCVLVRLCPVSTQPANGRDNGLDGNAGSSCGWGLAGPSGRQRAFQYTTVLHVEMLTYGSRGKDRKGGGT